MRSFLITCTLPLVVQGFAPLGSLQAPPRLTVQQHIVAPEHVDFLNVALTNFQHSQLLADASAAVASDAPKDEGLWQQYLNIFKSTLVFIHATVDEPLRSQGITQTWGISIALFTISKSSSCVQDWDK